MVWIDITVFIIFCVLMIISASSLVNSLAKLAAYFRASEFVIAFVVMGISTSIPELFIGITSALAGNPTLALGTVIGSNIVDLTIVIGIPVLLSRGIKITSKKTKKESMYMFFIASLPVAMMLIGNGLSRIDGIILIAIFITYNFFLLKQGRVFRKELSERITRLALLSSLVKFIIAIVILYFSAGYVVKYATKISVELFLPSILIGLFLVSIGTSLPELIFNIQSVFKNHPDMVLGDTMGSVVVNSTLILGLTAIISPISAPFFLFFSSSIFMILVCFLFATFVESGSKLYWKEGVALILLYSFFIIIEFYIKTLGG